MAKAVYPGPVEALERYRVPSDLLARTDELQPWFDESHDWIATLKPKPTTRKKKKRR